jgi:hypothetical protein
MVLGASLNTGSQKDTGNSSRIVADMVQIPDLEKDSSRIQGVKTHWISYPGSGSAALVIWADLFFRYYWSVPVVILDTVPVPVMVPVHFRRYWYSFVTCKLPVAYWYIKTKM